MLILNARKQKSNSELVFPNNSNSSEHFVIYIGNVIESAKKAGIPDEQYMILINNVN
ncbi:hypothetical protein ACA348_04315 [Orientia tsutsugamushi]|uniref:hypothetical protein n=1 Tax=Orientia tsutsugamushi TaxID=784 RepID=UPI00352829FD